MPEGRKKQIQNVTGEFDTLDESEIISTAVEITESEPEQDVRESDEDEIIIVPIDKEDTVPAKEETEGDETKEDVDVSSTSDETDPDTGTERNK